MKVPILAALAAATLAGASALAQMPGAPQHPGNSQHPPAAVHTPSPRPSYAVHPGARGFVGAPRWRHPARLPAYNHGHGHFHFQFAGHSYIVLAGPIYVAPYYTYPYVSTPYYPASFYAPDDTSADAGYFLYYCPSPQGYYPDVTDCPSGWWQTVPDDGPGGYPPY